MTNNWWTGDGEWRVAGTDVPCSRCGECCRQLPCSLAGDDDPCLALHEDDGVYSCRLVDVDIPGVAELLLIGLGCGATVVPACLLKVVDQ